VICDNVTAYVYCVVYIVESMYFLSTNFGELEYVIMGYVIGVIFWMWSISVSWMVGVLILFPFCRFIIKMLSNIVMGGVVLNE